MKTLRQTAIPCTLIRGGTSKGPFFLATDLPADESLRDRVLLAVMGSPDVRQIDGVGGADPLTSKVAIVSKSSRSNVDIDYLFAQVVVDKPLVDVSPNCGNMLAGVAPFAIEKGLVAATPGETRVSIYMVNTGILARRLSRFDRHREDARRRRAVRRRHDDCRRARHSGADRHRFSGYSRIGVRIDAAHRTGAGSSGRHRSHLHRQRHARGRYCRSVFKQDRL